MNLDEQVKSDMTMLAETHALSLTQPEDWAEEIEDVELTAYTYRVLEQNGHTVEHEYGELNWLADALGLPVDHLAKPTLPIGGSNGQ
jgi:hypothetical protein